MDLELSQESSHVDTEDVGADTSTLRSEVKSKKAEDEHNWRQMMSKI